jgi:uncharacterized repeat protein (TIGR03803 family)
VLFLLDLSDFNAPNGAAMFAPSLARICRKFVAAETVTTGGALMLFFLSAPESLTAQSFNMIHSFAPLSGFFQTNNDGANCAGGLVLSGNTLFGTASHGGIYGAGSIFAVQTDGTGFTNLHSFTAVSGAASINADGAYPLAGLTLNGGVLFGTASYGGTFGAGTVFRMNTNGTGFTNLHSFPAPAGALLANSDGAHPQAPLLWSSSTLYGTCFDGGNSGNGSVFGLGVDGSGFTNWHSFSAAYYNTIGYYTNLDGANPLGGLVMTNGNLFGTAVYCGRGGQGVLFAVNTDSAVFTNLHDFTLTAPDKSGNYTNSDGANPAVTLTLVGPLLYGAAQNGGRYGYGTVFATSTDGSSVTALHHFNSTLDGANPMSPLLFSGQTFYGTASYGGGFGQGTVFTLSTNGTGFSNLYYFSASPSQTNSDGANPVTGLVLLNNTLYGTTYYGALSGEGSIFSLALSPATPPMLGVERAGQSIVLNWPTASAGFQLEYATRLGFGTAWTSLGSAPAIINGQNVLTNPIAAGQLFFRLRN